MRISISSPIPGLGSIPGPSRPGYGPSGSYDFQFEVAAGQVGITVLPRVNGLRFTIKWQDGTEQAITSAQTNLQSPTTQAGIISINNEELDTTWCDDFAVASGKQFVTKVISWGINPWNRLNNAFKDCTNLTDISTTSLIADTGANIIKMFSGCTSLLEADIRNWDLTAGVNWYGGSPFGGLVNLEKLDMTGMTIKLTARSDNAFSSVGSATTDGCELLMSNIDWSTSTSAGTYTVYWFTSVRFKNTSDLSGWKFPSSSWAGTGMFNSAKIIGTDAVLNLSNWTTYSGSLFPSFSSFNSGLGNTGAKIDLTNMGMSNVNSMSNSFYFTDVSKIIGLSTWGATAGNVNMNRTFWGSDHLSFSDDDNFSNTFIQSLTPTRIDQTFMSVGVSSPNGVAPNISNIDLSGCTTTSQAFSGARFTNVPDLASATFSSTSTIAMDQTFNGIRISDADAHVDFSNTAVKISSAVQMFSGAHIDKVTFGNNVDFSSLTTVANMFYYPGNPIEVKFPTNADFSSLASTGNWFAGLVGPTTGPLTTCQIDNLIRRFRATAYGNALNVNFYQGQITEAPSIVQAQEAELVANGWTITANSTDATLPFVYPSYSFDSEVTQSVTPTTVPTGATFSSTDPGVTVNASTGVVSWDSTYMGLPIIRCTYADGCYNEVQMSMLVTVDNNYSMEFDGVSHVRIGKELNSVFQDAFSYSAWVKFNSVNANYQSFLSAGFPFQCYIYNGTVKMWISSSNSTSTESIPASSTLTANTWYHVAFTRSGNGANNTNRIYINGQPNVTDVSSTTVALSNANLTIGSIESSSGSANYYFNGNIDEVSLFNRELTAAQIKLIYDANSTNKAIKLSSLPGGAPVAWYRMGD